MALYRGTCVARVWSTRAFVKTARASVLPILALFVTNSAPASGLMTQGKPDPVAVDETKATEDSNLYCGDVQRGGPDWYDDGWHLDDWQRIVSECRQNQANITLDVRGGAYNPVQFVHVGKCAGSSITLALQSVAPGAVREIHIRQVDNCKAEKKKQWIVSVRDPLSRAISAFNWRSPHNGNSALFYDDDVQEQEFYSCFETVNDFAEALQDQSTCGSIARRAMDKPIKSEHLGKGFRYYFENSLECVLAQDVYLIRSETFVDDIKDVCGHFKWTLPEEVPHDKGHYPLQHMTYLSPKGKRLLIDALKGDYEVLRALESVAKNGKPGTY